MSLQIVGNLKNPDNIKVQGQLVYAEWPSGADKFEDNVLYFHGEPVPDIYLENGRNRRLLGAAKDDVLPIKNTSLSAVLVARAGPARVHSSLLDSACAPGEPAKARGKSIGLCIIKDIHECIVHLDIH